MKGIPSINFLWKLSTTAKIFLECNTIKLELEVNHLVKVSVDFGPIKVPKLLELQQHFQKWPIIQ